MLESYLKWYLNESEVYFFNPIEEKLKHSTDGIFHNFPQWGQLWNFSSCE